MNRRIAIPALVAATVLASCSREVDFDACGQIDAVQVVVSAESSGRIIELNMEEGDRLEAGQCVGAIDSVQLHLQAQELSQRIDGAQSRLIDIKTQMQPNEKQLESLQNDLRVYSALLKDNAATQKQVDDLKYKIDILKGQMDAQKQSWENNNESVRSEIGTYEIQLAQRRDQLSKCRIVSPVSGTVLSKYVEQGESVNSGKQLFKLADMQHTYVRAYFTSEQLGSLKLGDKVKVLPDDGSKSLSELEGRIFWISDRAEFTPKNIQTRNERADMVYAVKVSVPNDEGALRLGMYAYVRI